MVMHIGRTLPPAASPIYFKDIVAGVAGFFEGNEIVTRFEDDLASFYQVRYCCAVSSGKAALVLILQALHEIYPDRDEVLIPAYTCYSVPSAIIRAGLRIQLCDTAPGKLDFDFDSLEKKLKNRRLLCVIPTHLFGLPADVERVKSMAENCDVIVVEDAAQAMGGGRNGKKTGTLGDVGLFSLGRGKAFSTVEGGIIMTDNDQIGRALEKKMVTVDRYGNLDCLKLMLIAVALSILIYPCLYWLPKLLPFLKLGKTYFNPSFPIKRLSPFQAGLAKRWKTRIAEFNDVRLKNINKIAGYYTTAQSVFGAVFPELIRFPVLISDISTKRIILNKSEKLGLGISDGYPDSIDGIEELSNVFAGNIFPGAKDIAARIVSLPVHLFVRDEDIQKIVKLLKINGDLSYAK